MNKYFLAGASMLVSFLSMVICIASPISEQSKTIDVYDFTMRLSVPRIYDNAQSLGSRKYQTQTVKGLMHLVYSADGKLEDIKFTDMVNKTHVMSNGKNVTYPNTVVDYESALPRLNAIGSNKTGKFKTASICFQLAAEPSYSIGEFDEDNALYVQLSGKGSFHNTKKYLLKANGYVTGTIGCGCTAYGHVSPTRKIEANGPGSAVDDVAAVHGTWKMVYSRQKSSR